MINNKKVLAVVAARGGSKGLPKKNIRMLGGKPLVAWPVQAAKNAPSVDRVIISTDDKTIAEVAVEAGAELPFMRPAELASDTASSMEVIRHAINTLADKGDKYDYILLLEPTSPLTDSDDIEKALAILDSARDRADSIVGISRVEAAHPEYDVNLGDDGIIKPFISQDFRSLKRRQDIQDLYFLDGSLYLSSVNSFLLHGSFYHERTLGFVVPRWKSFEVDDLLDWIIIESLIEKLPLLRTEPDRIAGVV